MVLSDRVFGKQPHLFATHRLREDVLCPAQSFFVPALRKLANLTRESFRARI